MTRWLTMVLANGSHEGKQIVDARALLPAVTPQIVSSPATEPAMRSGFYGYGFNVGATSAARMELSHSGGFVLGAGTNFVILPSADVAIVALTNATVSGVPESLTAEFADLVQFGEVREDWYKLYGDIFKPMEQPTGSLVGQKPPANPAPSRAAGLLRRHLQQRLLGPGAHHRERRQVAARPWRETGCAPGPLGRQRLHLLVGLRKLAAGNDFQGDVRRQQADPGVLRHVQERDVHEMTTVPGVEATGLTDAEVAQRVADGKTNDVPTRAARSVSDIVRANVFTRINAILGVLLVIVLSTGSVINGSFGLLIIANSAIGIIQELRAKQTLDKLAIVGQAKPLVRRQSGTKALLPSEVVLDDVIEIGPGDQIVVDGEVLEENNVEVDESLLTGEADLIAKDAGDNVMSGSFVVAGSGAYRATKVGHEAYAAKLAEEASKFTLVNSELRSGINKILQFITYLLIPAGLLIIYTQLFTTDAGWRESVLRMVGALVPMVPEGLVLMTSIAFAVGVVRLGRRQCLVNELPAIEGLARVDVVCADKTGTLTESGMRVSDLKPLSEAAVGDILAQLASDRRPAECQHAGHRRGLQDAAGVDGQRDGTVQVGHQMEWCVLR